MRQFLSTEDSINCAQRRQRFNRKILELHPYSLCTAKHPFVIKAESNQLYCLTYLIGQLARITMRRRGSVTTPISFIIAGFVPLDPFVNPLTRVTQRPSYSRGFLPAQVPLDRKYPVALWVFLHRQLLSRKAAELESKSRRRSLAMSFQRTVTNVVALIPVTNVVALVI
jgi:hypothetical protein